MQQSNPSIVLSIAGHDPSGGAGIQADIETVGSLGGYAATAITCLTVQDTVNVSLLAPVEPALLEQQVRTVLADYRVDAIKIGLIGTAEIATTIAQIMADYPEIPIVFDPVLAAGGGTELAGEKLIEAIRHALLPLTTLVTPNSVEARRLSGMQRLEDCADILLQFGAKAVLVTGTHEESEEVINQLYRPGLGVLALSWPRLRGSYHGSGCTLASAIATLLAQGYPLEDAVIKGQNFTWESLSHAFNPGRGQAIPKRHQLTGSSK